MFARDASRGAAPHAQSSTRYVSTSRRQRLLMAPIFDLANHDRDCLHLLGPYDVSDFLTFLAGAPLKKGDEVRATGLEHMHLDAHGG